VLWCRDMTDWMLCCTVHLRIATIGEDRGAALRRGGLSCRPPLDIHPPPSAAVIPLHVQGDHGTGWAKNHFGETAHKLVLSEVGVVGRLHKSPTARCSVMLSE
jgi:hypothetical protein